MERLFFTSFNLFSVTVEFENLRFHFMLFFYIWFANLILEVPISKKVSGKRVLSDSKVIRTHNHLPRKRTLNHLAKLASLAKWLSVRLLTKWLWVRITLLSLKLQIWGMLRARSSLTFRQTIECRFTLKLVRDMIITYSQKSITSHSTDLGKS